MNMNSAYLSKFSNRPITSNSTEQNGHEAHIGFMWLSKFKGPRILAESKMNCTNSVGVGLSVVLFGSIFLYLEK